ncbi:MAG: ParB/RepB/Spo0J family partition protein [Anaerolineae bacterium]
MSRKRRERGDNPDNLLSELSSNETTTPFDGLTASDIADAAYASGVGHDDPFAKLGRSREKIHQIQIDAIIPSPTQPRRAIPSTVRQYWSGLSDEESMALFFQRWLDEVNLERRAVSAEPFPLDAYLNGDETPRVAAIADEEALGQIDSAHTRAKEASLMRVVELAASINRDGLINPISIAQNGRLWEIETGERRWLAYQLLNWRMGGDTWLKIPARQVDGVDIWRQATENNARADLNAIAKARQFALLLMDILAGDQNFDDYNDFEHEQDFYAQVADGRAHPVPSNMGEQLINAMGISDVGQLRHIRRLLRLPQPVWTVADDLNWTESFIQKNLLRNAQSDDEVIVRTIKFARAEGYADVSVLTPYHDLPKEIKPSQSPDDRFTYQAFSDGLGTKVYQFIQKMPKKEQQRAIAYLEDMLESLKSG